MTCIAGAMIYHFFEHRRMNEQTLEQATF